jgi:hypothetical protein
MTPEKCGKGVPTGDNADLELAEPVGSAPDPCAVVVARAEASQRLAILTDRERVYLALQGHGYDYTEMAHLTSATPQHGRTASAARKKQARRHGWVGTRTYSRPSARGTVMPNPSTTQARTVVRSYTPVGSQLVARRYTRSAALLTWRCRHIRASQPGSPPPQGRDARCWTKAIVRSGVGLRGSS